MEMERLWEALLRVIIAFVLAAPTAWEREAATRTMGLRTFPLVAVASCGYILIVLGVTDAGDSQARARVLQGLIAGIGFIGGGAILKSRTGVRGTATAASVWGTGAIGAAVGFGEYEVALVLAVINFLTLRLLTPVERKISKDDRRNSEYGAEQQD